MTEIFDRGSKKWVSLMIPELREGLRRLFADPPPERPELDEQRIEELNRTLEQALRSGQRVTIKYWEENGEREATGQIVWYELGKIRLANEDGKVHIDVNRILDVLYYEQLE